MSGQPGKVRNGYEGAFIVGTGRCGSTLLSQALALHPDVLSLSEFFINLCPDVFPPGALSGAALWDHLSERASLMNQLLQIQAEPPEFLYPVDAGGRFDRVSGVPRIAVTTLPALSDDPDALLDRLEKAVLRFPTQTATEHYVRLFALLGDWLNRGLWVERSGASGLFVEQLVAHFPAARYIHLTRDADVTARSMSRHPAFRLMLLWGEFISRCDCDVLNGGQPLCEIPPDLADLVPGRFSRESFDAWERSPEQFQPLCYYQTSCIETALRALPAERVLVLRYEQIVDQPIDEFSRMADFLGLDDPRKWAHDASHLVHRR